MDIDQLFGGMAKAQMFGRGQYMGPGNYLAKTKTLKIIDGHNGRSFIYEFEIVQSDNDKHKPGTTGSWVVKLDKKEGNPWGDVKGLVFALTGVDPNSVGSPEQDPSAHSEVTNVTKAAVDPSYAKKLGLPEDFLVGKEVRLEAFLKKTKKGGDFTVHKWSPAG